MRAEDCKFNLRKICMPFFIVRIRSWKSFWLQHFFKKNGPFLASFSLFSSFQCTVDSKQMFNINKWLDSNCRPLVSEATPLPTEPQPLPCYGKFYLCRNVMFAKNIFLLPLFCSTWLGGFSTFWWQSSVPKFILTFLKQFPSIYLPSRGYIFGIFAKRKRTDIYSDIAMDMSLLC